MLVLMLAAQATPAGQVTIEVELKSDQVVTRDHQLKVFYDTKPSQNPACGFWGKFMYLPIFPVWRSNASRFFPPVAIVRSGPKVTVTIEENLDFEGCSFEPLYVGTDWLPARIDNVLSANTIYLPDYPVSDPYAKTWGNRVPFACARPDQGDDDVHGCAMHSQPMVSKYSHVRSVTIQRVK